MAIHRQPPRTADHRCRGNPGQSESGQQCQALRRRAWRHRQQRGAGGQAIGHAGKFQSRRDAERQARQRGRARRARGRSAWGFAGQQQQAAKHEGSRQHVAHGRGERRQAGRTGRAEQGRQQRQQTPPRQGSGDDSQGQNKRQCRSDALRQRQHDVAQHRCCVQPVSDGTDRDVHERYIEGLQLRRRDIGPEPPGDQRVRVIDVVIAQIPIRIRRRMRGA